MKNQNRVPAKRRAKNARNQSETASAPAHTVKPWTGRNIEPLIPGRFRPELNESQACTIIALAVVNANRDLEAFCGRCIELRQILDKVTVLAETMAIASAVVRACVLSALGVDRLRAAAGADDPIPVIIPGITGFTPLSREEALLEMIGALYACMDDLSAHEWSDPIAYAEFFEAILLVDDIRWMRGMTSERDDKKGADVRFPTWPQEKAWIAKSVALTGYREEWRKTLAANIAEE